MRGEMYLRYFSDENKKKSGESTHKWNQKEQLSDLVNTQAYLLR